jgi:hypothetical protein
MKATIVDLRYRMKDALRAIDRGEILPVRALAETKPLREHPFFGMWAGRDDMADPAAFVREIRKNRLAH